MNEALPGGVEHQIAYNAYGGYCVPLTSIHRPAAQAIVAGGVWEPETVEFLISHGVSGDIVHAGTFFGDFLPALARSRQGDAKVWAFEPNSENYHCACLTVSLNVLSNVILANQGLGDKREVLTLETREPNGVPLGGASRFTAGETGGMRDSADFEPADVIRLDDVIPEDRTVSVIQLDVEGFERRALDGAIRTIRRCLPVIVVETLPDEDWLAENLWPLGYKVGPTLHENTVLLPRREQNR